MKRLRTGNDLMVLSSVLVLLMTMVGCASQEGSPGLEAITARGFDAHLRFLSSDLLEGRAPGTRGSELAASYIANQFALAGLVPALGDSSFRQPVPLVAWTPEARLAFRAPGGAAFRPRYGAEFVAWSEDTTGIAEIDSELIFVGYGIHAPEWDWDDYKDVDVSGRIILVLANDPGPWVPGRFRSDTLTYYGLSAYKLEEAARRGAAGVIFIHAPETVGVGWSVIQSSLMRERVGLDGVSDSGVTSIRAWLSQDAAEQVVSMAGLGFATLLETARSDKFRPVLTGVRVSASLRNATRRFVDFNLVGLLPGSDPQLAREVVLYTAHYDHLGIAEAVESDSIYNGAYDNASGVAMLLCLAEAFGRLPRRPARSILFVAVTAEESGLLGSLYYVDNPVIPLTQSVANINIDGVNLWGATEDVTVLGAERSSIREAAVRAARAENLRLEGDPSPEQGYLYRSDQFSFLRAGVPAIMVGHGLDFIGRMPGWGEQMMQEYMDVSYHKPSDEYEPDFDLRGAVQQGRFAFRVGLGLANETDRPVWRDGGEFRRVPR